MTSCLPRRARSWPTHSMPRWMPLTVYMLDVTTIPVNMAGLPGMSIPCGFVDGMPVGAQLIGKPLGEETLLRAAYTFEQATEFHKAVAPLGGKK